MQDLYFPDVKAVNLEALDEQLKSQLGADCPGASFGPGGLTVHLADDARPGAGKMVSQIVMAHDPEVLTSAQVAVIDLRSKLQQMRQANAAPLDLSAYSDDLVGDLARRVVWLETEIRNLLNKGA